MRTRNQRKDEILVLAVKALSTRFTSFFFVFLALGLILFSRIQPAAFEGMRVFVTDLAVPVLDVVSRPFAAASDTVAEMTDIRTLRSENIRLSEENERLKRWYGTALKLQAENQSLRAFLNFSKDPDLGYLTVRVISEGGGAFVKSFLVPVGSKDGVKKNQAVLSGDGMIGRVIEVGNNSARVLMITDLNSRIPVIIQNTRQKAILMGKNEDMLKLERLSIESSGAVEVGARVVTSGDGGIFPPDMPIGVIDSFDETGAHVRPLSDLSRLSYVQIVESPQVAEPDLLSDTP